MTDWVGVARWSCDWMGAANSMSLTSRGASPASTRPSCLSHSTPPHLGSLGPQQEAVAGERVGKTAQFKSDLSEKEAQQKRLTEDHEHSVSKQREDLQECKARYRRLEAQRAETVSQFQAMMQSHWNEALQLFAISGTSLRPSPKAPHQEAEADPKLAFLPPSNPHKRTPKGETLCSNTNIHCPYPAQGLQFEDP